VHIGMELEPLLDNERMELCTSSMPPQTRTSLEHEREDKCVISQVLARVLEEVQSFQGERTVGVGLEEGAPRRGTLVEHLVGNKLGVDLEEMAPPVLVSQKESN
jgi:hypothetical protein